LPLLCPVEVGVSANDPVPRGVPARLVASDASSAVWLVAQRAATSPQPHRTLPGADRQPCEDLAMASLGAHLETLRA